MAVSALRARHLRTEQLCAFAVGTDDARRYAAPMCMQCMAGAMAAGAGATGMRVWLIARAPLWLTPSRRALLTRGLLAVGLLAAALVGPSPV